MFTEEEIKILYSAASYHNNFSFFEDVFGKYPPLDKDDIDGIINRLIDFNCLTTYQSWHEEQHGLTKELAVKTLEFAKTLSISSEKIQAKQFNNFVKVVK